MVERTMQTREPPTENLAHLHELQFGLQHFVAGSCNEGK
jgi:hypothetical protein